MIEEDYTLPTQLWMVRDVIRADAYRAALKGCVPEGARVIDVGSGTGLLSIFAAEAGASHVTAIEQSSQVAAMARKLIASTPYADRITVIAADARTVELPDQPRADVLVSEWMGFYAIEENLLGVVCDVRDRLCVPDAVCLPGRFAVKAAPVEESYRIQDAMFWASKPWGLELQILADAVDHRPEFGGEILSADTVCAEPATFWEDDVRTLGAERANGVWRSGTVFEASRDATVTGVALWFDTSFPDGTELSIAPGLPATHWGSTVLPVQHPMAVSAGTPIEVRVTCTPTIPGHSSTFWAVRIGDGNWEYHGGAGSSEAVYELA